MRSPAFVFALTTALGAASVASATTLPPGFVDEVLPWTFAAPTKLAFLPDGRLIVAEKGGTAWIVTGGSRTVLWSRPDEVLDASERGLVSVAVDPDFRSNLALYFLYTCDPDSNGDESNVHAFCRLTRYQLPTFGANAVDENTRAVLLGTGWSDGVLSASGTHNVADLEWGRDGTLLVGTGDGAHFETVDAGGLDPGQFTAGRSDPAEDIGAFRSQMIGSLNGKVLRVDPANGHGLPSNPFWDGNPESKRSRVWAYGLRNPFRIARRPLTGALDPAAGDPGTLYTGDVGWDVLEELDVIAGPGMNFGWPCLEANAQRIDYQSSSPASFGCETIGTPANPSPATLPLLWVHHADPDLSDPTGVTGSTIVGGAFYGGALYPAAYQGLYFFADYLEGWIRTLQVNASNQRVAVNDFATDFGGVVSFAAHPQTGDLWCATIWDGLVHRIRWTGNTGVPAPAPDARVSLSDARPNPSRGAVWFTLRLPSPARVAFDVLDPGGRRVWSAPVSDQGAGAVPLLWPGLDAAGARARPGLYLARATVNGRSLVRRVALLR